MTSIDIYFLMKKRLIPIGRKIGKLTVMECLFIHDNSKAKRMLYRCLCDCGNEKTLSSVSLSPQKGTTSCGCAYKEAGRRKRKGLAWEFTAKSLWKNNYQNGCSYEKFLELSQKNCYYCGSPPSNKTSAMSSTSGLDKDWYNESFFIYNGLDRIDSTKDHSEDNLVPCCKICNWMKSNSSLENFLSQIKKIYIHLNMDGTKLIFY